jgi:hypothetical protein
MTLVAGLRSMRRRGVITVANGTLLDAEAASSHNVTVVATSSDASTANATYAIAVTNVNDTRWVQVDSNAAVNTVAENAANGTVVGITALGTDADVGATVTYSLSNDAGGRLRSMPRRA